MCPDPTHPAHSVLRLWLVGLTILGCAGAATAAPNCRTDEVARGEWITETCSCRGWTIAAECRSRCCGMTNMVAAIHRMCSEICERSDPDSPVEELVRKVDDGSTLLRVERSPIAEEPGSRSRVRLALSGFALLDAAGLASDLFDGVAVDGRPKSPELDSGSLLGLGAIIDLSPRWSLDLGVLQADDATAEADLLFTDGSGGRLRSDFELTGLQALARYGLDRPAPSSHWHLSLGARSLRLEPSRTTLARGEESLELELPRLDVDEAVIGLGWRWPWTDRWAGDIEATWGSESRWAARFGFTLDVGPGRPARRLESYDLDVDTNRNGRVEDGADDADEASFSRDVGAIVLANLDADDAPVNQDLGDAGDQVLGSRRDVDDLAPLIVRRRSSRFVRDPELRISLGTAERVRIYWSGQPVLGPASGTVEGPYKVWRIPSAAFAEGEVRLVAEALEYPSATHGGQIGIELTGRGAWFFPGRRVLDRVRLQIAPWLMIHHLEPTRTVYSSRPSSPTITALRDLLDRHELADWQPSIDGSRWVQDWQEIGFSRGANGAAMHSAYRASCQEVVRRGVDMATFDVRGCGISSTMDSTGNLEVTPPVADWPLGRIYYGGAGNRRMAQRVRDFLDAQRVQSPVELDSSWLRIGHVDEFVSFVPNPNAGQRGEKPFKVLIASPRRAMGLLYSSPRQSWDAPACDQTSWTVLDLLMGWGVNTLWQGTLSSIRLQMISEFGLSEKDFIEVPVLYRNKGGRAVAWLPNAVNLLVVDRHLVLPDPCFGPWRDDIVQQLAATGYQLDRAVDGFSFIPTWDYHLGDGEIHCGTNSLRELPATPWWQRW